MAFSPDNEFKVYRPIDKAIKSWGVGNPWQPGSLLEHVVKWSYDYSLSRREDTIWDHHGYQIDLHEPKSKKERMEDIKSFMIEQVQKLAEKS